MSVVRPRSAMACVVGLLLIVAGCSSSADSADEPVRSDTGQAPAGEETAADPEVEEGDAATSAAAAPAATLAAGEPGGPGALVDSSAEAGIDEALLGIRGHAVAVADVNGDGWDDLFVGTFADRPLETYEERGADGPAPDRLLLGSPSGFALDPTFEGRFGRSAGAIFDDLDDDGDPDLVVSRNVREVERGRAPSEIYRNDDGSLVPATVLDEQRGGRAIGVVDFNRDGRRDLVLVEDRWSGGRTGLFRNDGDLVFTEVTEEVGFPDDVFGLGVGIGDLDEDGIDDLVVGGSNRWFLGDGSGFVEAATSPLPWELHGEEDDPAHVILVDTNGDDRLDIFMGQHFNSTIDAGIAEPVRLFLNEGADGGEPRFEDVTERAGLPLFDTKSPQILLADIDGDGRADLVTTASYPDGSGAADARLPTVVGIGEPADGLPTFESPDVTVDPHYWIDGVTLDANGDGRTDVFFVEWEPALGSRLFLNLPTTD